jgi:hypothetical protein
MRFGIAFLGFWLHFGRLFELKIHEKWIQKSDEFWHAFLEGFLRIWGFKWSGPAECAGRLEYYF